jgi:hypothetical protein
LARAVVVAPAMMLMTSLPRFSRRYLPADSAQHLRLDREHHHVGLLDRAGVVLDRADAVRGDQLAAPVGAGMARDDPIRRNLLAAQQAGDHGLRHHA